MNITIKLASSLADYCGGVSELVVSAATVGEAILAMEKTYPNVYRSVCDDRGVVRQHVNIFVDSDFIAARTPMGLDTQLESGNVMTIWPAVSGG